MEPLSQQTLKEYEGRSSEDTLREYGRLALKDPEEPEKVRRIVESDDEIMWPDVPS